MAEKDFNPLTSQFGIAGTSYNLQMGIINDKWAIRILKEKNVVNCNIFKDIGLDKLPEGNQIVNWVLNAVAISINPRQIWKTVQILLKQAAKNREKKKVIVPIKEAREKELEKTDEKESNIERIMIFIDNSNIFKGFQKYNVKADYEKLKNIITRGRELQSIFLYEGVVYPMSPEKKKWYNELSNRSNYVIKASFDKIAFSDVIEKKVDIKFAIDIISLAYENAYDTAVLISGDGDFIPVVKKVKELDKNVEVWAFRYSLANALKEELGQENIYYLNDILSKINIKKL